MLLAKPCLLLNMSWVCDLDSGYHVKFGALLNSTNKLQPEIQVKAHGAVRSLVVRDVLSFFPGSMFPEYFLRLEYVS